MQDWEFISQLADAIDEGRISYSVKLNKPITERLRKIAEYLALDEAAEIITKMENY